MTGIATVLVFFAGLVLLEAFCRSSVLAHAERAHAQCSIHALLEREVRNG